MTLIMDRKKIVFILLLFLCGCKSELKQKEEVVNRQEYIDLSNVKYENEPVKLSSFIDEITYIPLSDTKLLKDIVQLYVADSLLFIRCDNDPSIYIFSSNGTYVKPLFDVGNGPGEAFCHTSFICNDEKSVIAFNGSGYIYNYTYGGEFLKKEKSEINSRLKKLVSYQGDILFYQLSNLLPQKGELCNPNGDYLLYGEDANSNELVYCYENYGKDEKAEYRGVIAELETADFLTGKLDDSFWFKNLYMDTLFIFNKEKSNFLPKYVFNLGDNSWDYRTFVHLYYLDKDYLNIYDTKTLLQELFLGNKYLVYRMKKGKDEGVGVYSMSDNKNLCFTNKYQNDLDSFLSMIDLKALLPYSFCDGEFLYLPINSYMFFEEGNSPFSLQLTEESNPIILKMKLK